MVMIMINDDENMMMTFDYGGVDDNGVMITAMIKW